MALSVIKGSRIGCITQKCLLVTMTGSNWNSLSKVSSTCTNFIQNVFNRFYSGVPKKTFTVAVEGNIGSGKTTLLKHFNGCPSAEVLQEPVEKWRNIDGHNALDLFYCDPERWAMAFQTYINLTHLTRHLQKTEKKPVKLMERSIYSAKYCFAENLHKSGQMPDIEDIILTKWFDWIVENNDCHLDLIVYLKTSPEVVHERIKQRCRNEEKAIPLDYLTNLHELHEDWLVRKTKFSVPCPVLILDANKDSDDMIKVFDMHRDRILGGH